MFYEEMGDKTEGGERLDKKKLKIGLTSVNPFLLP